jgi:MATE family multidrug resistance protein
MADESATPVTTGPQDDTSLLYMIKLAGPAVVTTFSFTIMQFADRFMVSRLGTNALAAVLPASMASFVPSALAMGALTSLNTFVSQSLGRGDRRGCANYFWQALYLGFAFFISVLIVVWPAAPWIFKVMGQPQEIVAMEVIYLRILLYAHVLAVINWAGNHFFMGIHRPIITLYASLCGQVANVIMNYLLIFGKWGFPAMGIAGAGWGTCIGIGVAAAINMFAFLGNRINAAFYSRCTLRINFRKMVDLVRIGLPSGLGLTLTVAFWGVILFMLVGKFGTAAVAATSAVLSYTNLAIMPVVGLATALTASVGKFIGQGRKELARNQTPLSLKIGLIYMAAIGILYFAFRDSLMTFWSADAKVAEAGMGILIFAAIYQAFDAAHIIYSGSLRGAGDTIWLALVAAGSLLILGLGGLFLVAFFPSLGVVGPWCAAALSAVAAGFANRWRFNSNKWMSIDLFHSRRPEALGQSHSTAE